ncbi:MAG: CvpA family protein [Acutalibacter sp.]|jgi:uncharacterized membrane protein required for colicin V production
MGIALDLILLAVCIVFVAVGAHRGLIRSAAHFLGAVVAACLAALLGGAAAQWVFDVLFRPALVERVGESLANLGSGDTYTAVQSVFSTLPEFLLRALNQAGISAASVTEAMAGQSGQAAELIADALAPVFVGFLKVLAVIVLFSLFMVLVRIGANVLSTAFRLPLLGGVNGLLGGVFGLLLAVVSIWIVLAAVQVFLPMLAADARAQVEDALRQSYVAGLIVNWNPLGIMFQ